MLTHSRYLFGGWTPNLPIDEEPNGKFFTKRELFFIENASAGDTSVFGE